MEACRLQGIDQLGHLSPRPWHHCRMQLMIQKIADGEVRVVTAKKMKTRLAEEAVPFRER